MKELLSSFLTDESGATAIEYGLIAALIAVGIIAAARSLGNRSARHSATLLRQCKTLDVHPVF